MMTRYLFRLDGSRENDEFMNLRRAHQVEHVYSGTPMKVGPGWILDYVEVEFDHETRQGKITLIELEAIEITARASCRKYLPENSHSVYQSFSDYLETVITQCRTTADPRLEAFQQLKNYLENAMAITVFTAGALRTSAEVLEQFPLLDQPIRQPLKTAQLPSSPQPFYFQGVQKLTRIEADGLRRTLRILHAVVIGRDHSGGSFKSWRNSRRKPLDKAASRDSAHCSELCRILSSKTESGLRVDCDQLAKELTNLWSSLDNINIHCDQVMKSVSGFFPIAIGFPEHENMKNVFEQARTYIDVSHLTTA